MENKDKRFWVRLPSSIYERLKVFPNMSKIVRNAIIAAIYKIETLPTNEEYCELKEIRRNISGAAGNINQIAHRVNMNDNDNYRDEILKMKIEIDNLKCEITRLNKILKNWEF